MIGILAGILLGLFIASPTAAQAPQSNNLDIKEDEFVGPVQLSLVKDNAIQPVSIPSRGNKSRRYNPASATSGLRVYSNEEVIQLIKDYSAEYGIDSKLPLAIAKCESGYNALARNRDSTASGVFQYLSSTWAATDQGRTGLSVFDAEANIKAAVSYIASRGNASPWNASKSCWS